MPTGGTCYRSTRNRPGGEPNRPRVLLAQSPVAAYLSGPPAQTPGALPDADGAVAQLGERVNGIHEVRGSIPLGSTNEVKGLVAVQGSDIAGRLATVSPKCRPSLAASCLSPASFASPTPLSAGSLAALGPRRLRLRTSACLCQLNHGPCLGLGGYEALSWRGAPGGG